MLESSFLTVNGQKVRHYVAGEGDPLIFIHGHRSDVMRWRGVVEYAARYFRVYAPDLPGHGQSPPFSHSHTMEAYAKLMVKYIEVLGCGPVKLAGGSMGGVIALLTAESRPDLVDKLVLAMTPYDKSTFGMGWRFPLIKSFLWLVLNVRPLRWAGQRLVESRLMYPIVRLGVPKRWRTPTVVDFEVAQWRVVSFEIWARTLWETLSVRFAESDGVVDVPTLILTAEGDHYLDVERNLAGLKELCPRNTVIALPLPRHTVPGEMTEDLIAGMGWEVMKALG